MGVGGTGNAQQPAGLHSSVHTNPQMYTATNIHMYTSTRYVYVDGNTQIHTYAHADTPMEVSDGNTAGIVFELLTLSR